MKVSNEAQEGQLKEIGANLRSARQKKQLSIEEIGAITCIRPAFLLALEEGRYEDLPEAVFVQGFVRRYADVVGLDSNALSQTFAAAFLITEYEVNTQNTDRKLSIHIPILIPYILLLAAAIAGLFYILQPKQTSQNISQQVESLAKASEQNTIPRPSIVPTPNPAASPTAIAGVTVTLELKEKSYVQVKADSKKVFEGDLKKGEKKTFSAKKELTVLSRNAGAVLVSTNSKQPKPLGDRGEEKSVIFTSSTASSRPKPIAAPN